MSCLVTNEEVFPALVKVLGLKEEHIISMSLALEMDEFPKITIERYLNSDEAASLAKYTGMAWPPTDDRPAREAPTGGG